MSKKETNQIIKDLEVQKQDFINMFNEINGQIQNEESRNKLWELTDIINDIERQIEDLKD